MKLYTSFLFLPQLFTSILPAKDENYQENRKYQPIILASPGKWIPPVSIWSQLKFPIVPEMELENRNSDLVPEPFDSSKINASISQDGYVIGKKFCQCGRSPWRLSRRRAVNENLKNDIPWTATLVMNKLQNVFCGGALLNDRMVITAAHCINRMRPSDLVVHIAEDDLLPSSSTIYQSHKFEVIEILIHPQYNQKTVEHDIALLRLAEPINFFEIPISPVCLPVHPDDYANSIGTVTEWVSVLDSRGKNSSDNLQKSSMDLISIAECNKQQKYNGLISENHICTKSCQGDHGGQLLVDKNNRKLLIGIGSWGLNCSGTNNPSVFTRVARYAAWIMKNNIDAEWCVE